MPTYNYYCPKCEITYEVFTKRIINLQVDCPRCRVQLEKMVTAPNIHTGSKKASETARENSRTVVVDQPNGFTIVTRQSPTSKSFGLICPCGRGPIIQIGGDLAEVKRTERDIGEAYANSRK